MIIGFDGSRAFVGKRTGTENYSYQLLKNLAKIDKANSYIVYLRSVAKQGNGWPENFQFQVIKWSRFWTQGGLALRTFKDHLDVLFVPAHTLPVIRYPGLKTVVTVHDLGSEYLPSMHQIKQRLYLGFMQRYQLQTATKIIAVSKATKGSLVKKIGIDSEKIKVIYEGYNKNLFKPVKSDLLVNSLSQYGLKSGSYFLFVGTIQPRKNLERLIKAFARLSELNSAIACLVLIGQKGWLSDEIYKLPKKLGIKEKVKFLGYVPECDLPSFYSGAAALTFLSLFEGFGLPILEAQASGCPVLTSNVSSMPEVADLPGLLVGSVGKGAIFVDPYSIDDIVEGMVEIINKDTKKRIVKAGFENIKRFSWEKCVRETLKILEAL